MLYADEMSTMSIYLSDQHGDVDPLSIQVEIRVNDGIARVFHDGDPGIEYNPLVDSLFINVLSVGGILPSARDSIFITILQACDISEGCSPNCTGGLSCYKFIKYQTECLSHPKPFTPNNDNINDVVFIEYPKRFEREATIKIYDVNNVEIKTVGVSSGSRYFWDGKDSKNIPARQGVYIYVVEVEGEVVCTGTIVLAR
jgi:gliding motility-associated-like protein